MPDFRPDEAADRVSPELYRRRQACAPEVPPALVQAIQVVWAAIAPDLGGLVTSQEELVEACTDADRLDPRMGLVDDGGAALAQWRALVTTHGLAAARRTVAVHPQLQYI